jgi:hypothetical protein
MSRNRSLGTLGAAMLIISSAAILVSAQSGAATSEYKTLYRFLGSADGETAFSGLVQSELRGKLVLKQ